MSSAGLIHVQKLVTPTKSNLINLVWWMVKNWLLLQNPRKLWILDYNSH